MNLPRTCLLCALAVCTSLAAEGEQHPEVAQTQQEVKRLKELTNLVQANYVEPVTREQLWHGAFRGMLSSLDPASRFLAPDEALLLNTGRRAQRHGFGFDWRHDPDNRRYVITRVIPGSPAAKASLYPGDTLVGVDGVVLNELSVHDARMHMLRLDGSCSLDLRRADGQRQTVIVEQTDLTDTGVGRSAIIDAGFGIGVVRLARFIGTGKGGNRYANTTTGVAFRQAVDALAEQGLRGLIIDMRANPGGDLIAAVEIADCFLDAGAEEPKVIVSVDGRGKPAQVDRHIARSATSFPLWPLVVLVDGETASSAEICAAAWRDHHRAVVVGAPTLGKTTIQQLYSLNNGAKIMLTVAHYRTPSGKNLAGTGLVPDIHVAENDLDRLKRHQATDMANRLKHDKPLQRAHEMMIALLLDRQTWRMR